MFYAAVREDELLRPRFEHFSDAAIAEQAEGFARFVIRALTASSEKDRKRQQKILHKVHGRQRITDAEFDGVAAILTDTLASAKADPEDIRELMTAVAGFRGDVVGR